MKIQDQQRSVKLQKEKRKVTYKDEYPLLFGSGKVI